MTDKNEIKFTQTRAPAGDKGVMDTFANVRTEQSVTVAEWSDEYLPAKEFPHVATMNNLRAQTVKQTQNISTTVMPDARPEAMNRLRDNMIGGYGSNLRQLHGEVREAANKLKADIAIANKVAPPNAATAANDMVTANAIMAAPSLAARIQMIAKLDDSEIPAVARMPRSLLGLSDQEYDAFVMHRIRRKTTSKA